MNSRAQLQRRHQNRYQRRTNSHDVTTAAAVTGSKETPEVLAAAGGACTSGRFTSFLVADILGIGCGYSCSTSGDVTLVTSSDRHRQLQQLQHKSSADFRVERLIRSSDDRNKTTSGL